jgi:hypothetical protein
MSIVKAASPNMSKSLDAPLVKGLFDEKIWQYGYDVLIDKAIECPCRTEGDNSNLSDCQNCGGTGWAFINPLQTKALITSINQDTKYKQWSQELIGNISVSLLQMDNASFMDRITMMNEMATFSEVRKVKVTETGAKFIFTSYQIEEIEDIFIFESSSTKLVRLSSTDYSIKTLNNFVIEFGATALDDSSNNSISVRYKHKVQYNILDQPHILRSSNDKNNLGQVIKIKLPNQYIARLAHYVLKPNFAGDGILNNTYR